MDRQPGESAEQARAALEGPGHPLVTIRFFNRQESVLLGTRYWYHVPTQGSLVQIWDGEEPLEVSHVIWGDQDVKVVMFR